MESAEGSAACQSSKVRKPHAIDPAKLPDFLPLKVKFYKSGAIIKWPSSEPPKPPETRDRSSYVQSVKSRMNCAFSLGNSETEWLMMVTLTYRQAPMDWETVRDHRVKFLDRCRKRWEFLEVAWFLEFQRRGAAHYHIFFGSGGQFGDEIAEEPTLEKRGKKILVGSIDEWLVSTWIDIVGDHDKRFLKFQRGGIAELTLNPDAAGRYAAKEASKRVQKVSPFPVKQWWGTTNHIKPRCRAVGSITVGDYCDLFPGKIALSKIWSGSEIRERTRF